MIKVHRVIGASTKPEEKPQAAAADCDVCEHLHYPMKNKPHGLCVIINNGDIIPGKAVTGLHIKDRTENAVDTKKLKCLFEKLDYKVEVHTNLTSSAMYEVLDSKRQTDHSKFDAFICFILGYGSKSELYGSDGTPISLSKLIQLFIPVVCPSLEGKPKLFFIKPCGVTKTQELYDIPIHDHDFFISYAASPGLSEDAMCTDQGSVYIQSLVETISESYSKLDVQYMSNLVHMNTFLKRDEQGHKQVAASFSTMTKMMYLCRNPVVAIEKYQTAVDATHLCHTPPMTSAKEREEQIIRPEIDFPALPLQYISNLVHMNRFPKRDEQGRKQVAASFSTMIMYIGGNRIVARVIQNADIDRLEEHMQETRKLVKGAHAEVLDPLQDWMAREMAQDVKMGNTVEESLSESKGKKKVDSMNPVDPPVLDFLIGKETITPDMAEDLKAESTNQADTLIPHGSMGAMTKCHRDVLRKVRVYMMENLEVDTIIQNLVGELLLTAADEDTLSVERTAHARTKALLDILPRKGDVGYTKLLIVLREQQTFVYQKLVETEQEIARSVQQSRPMGLRFVTTQRASLLFQQPSGIYSQPVLTDSEPSGTAKCTRITSSTDTGQVILRHMKP